MCDSYVRLEAQYLLRDDFTSSSRSKSPNDILDEPPFIEPLREAVARCPGHVETVSVLSTVEGVVQQCFETRTVPDDVAESVRVHPTARCVQALAEMATFRAFSSTAS